jgi:molybdopterin converting factor small subunit
MPHVLLPAPLRDYTGGASPVEVTGASVASALSDLVARYPRLRRHLFDDAGRLRGFVNVYLDDRDVRDLEEILAEDSVLMIVPSVAGGDGRLVSSRSILRTTRSRRQCRA